MSRLEVLYPKSRTERALYRKVPISVESPDGEVEGFKTVPDGSEEVFYETLVDVDALQYIAMKAAGNKSQKARSGAFEVRILSRRRIS